VPPTVRIDASPAQKKERQEKVVAQRAEIAPKPNPVPSSSPRVAWSRLARTVGALSLCIISVVAWHRIQGIPGSQAHNQPRLQQINAIAVPNSPHSAKPAAIAESAAAIAPSAATAQPLAAPEAAVKPASIATVVPTPKQGIRVHDVASAPNLPLSGQDSGIQASRPPLRFVYPVYPDVRARGVVALTARVDSDGTVRTVRVVSGNRALAAAAVRAVRQWRYRPYLKDGQPAATETNIVISFFSDDAISMSFPPSIPATR
jgi:TonB family protein